MRGRKDKQFLVFEFEDGKDVKFDMSNGQFIGKKGKPVSGLTGQLKGYSINEVIDSFEDEKYRKFLYHIHNITNKYDYYGGLTYYSNVGTFLNHVRRYLNLEQFFACGFTNIDLKSRRLKMSDVPKALIKTCRLKDIRLTEPLLSVFNTNPNMWNLLLNADFEMFNVANLMHEGYRSLGNFTSLINEYKYNPKALATYIDNIRRFEGENSDGNAIQLLHDYARQMSVISPKYEKYPRYLATTHNIASRNYARLKKEFNEELFKRRVDKTLEFTHKDWIILYPSETQEIKDEAVQQNNCVASYIDNVIEGQCHILFLRKKDSKSTSVVTLELRGNKIVQAKGRFNRDVNQEERLVIDKYEEHLNNKKESAAA
ncbi:MAG: PcfJ domain-containing protein [Cellulosilyticaceae bacterium]